MDRNFFGNNIGKQIGVGVGVAAILTAIFTFLINFQQQSRVDFTVITDRMEKQNNYLENELRTARKERDELQQQVATLSSFSYEDPIPSWFKDLSGKMIMLNAAYEDTFLKPNGYVRYDYIGKTDMEFWGIEANQPEQAKRYRQNDLDVMMKKKAIRSEEVIMLGSKKQKLIVIKYPVWSDSPDWNGKKVIGVGGRAIISDCQ